jgi:2-haloacid dehalogenase
MTIGRCIVCGDEFEQNKVQLICACPKLFSGSAFMARRRRSLARVTFAGRCFYPSPAGRLCSPLCKQIRKASSRRFTDIGSAVMKMLADTRGIKIDDEDKKELTERFSTMPPHAEVPGALRKLRDEGFRLFTLTDNLLEVQTRQLEHAGIVDLFERRFSADGVKHHKPSREAYAYVEEKLGVRPSQLCLVACHTWDTLGAVAAGWEAALIKRVGNDLLGVGPQPQIVGADLNDVADQLIARQNRMD